MTWLLVLLESLLAELNNEVVAIEARHLAYHIGFDVEGLLDLVRGLAPINDIRLICGRNDEPNSKRLIPRCAEVLS